MSEVSLAYLQQYLEPLAPWLDRPDVTDIFINRPGEIWVEKIDGRIDRVDLPTLTTRVLERLARQIAAHSHQGVSRAHPILSATLANGARAQIILPPATRGDIAIAIRRHAVAARRLEDYEADGSFAAPAEGVPLRRRLSSMLTASKPSEMIAEAVRSRANILISGGTASGKSTFLNALIREIPGHERIILIEDTPEIQLQHENSVGLLAARGQLGESLADSDALLTAALRMRPDRIMLGEVRGSEAFTFLRAVNTGHPGSMTTVHADSPVRAFEQLALLVLQTGTQLRHDDILAYARSVIDVVVQLERTAAGRIIREVSVSQELDGRCT